MTEMMRENKAWVLFALSVAIFYALLISIAGYEQGRADEAEQVVRQETVTLNDYGSNSCIEFELLKGNVEDDYTVVLHQGMVYVLEDARFYGRPLASGNLGRSTIDNSPNGD